FSSSPSLVNCILWNDAPQEVYFREDYGPNSIMIAYSDIQGGEAGIVTNDNGTVYWEYGNLDLDPFFTDPENGDYHLTENSPCIDAGTAFFVFEGDTLVNMSEDEYYGTAPDMGAFEYDGTVDNDYELEITNYELGNAYPNPFNPSTTISYAVETNGRLSLQIYNITGQLIETLVNEQVEAGYHTVVWFAENQPSGIYFAKLVAGDFTKTQKLVLLK
ncbi:MAG: T9SS type A sorting domain-containing protein, partial [Candidatus Marinimicrobia bacterium]|nr:T9SS type A sorting domain-containing protein [Candidatus Neomarinimicrobiota bacterium]